MLNPAAAARRALPSVDRLLNDSRVGELVERHGRALVLETVRAVLAAERSQLESDTDRSFDEERFIGACTRALEEATRPSLKPVFNMTGTVLHTNLGRAIMPRCAAEAVMQVMTQPANLEFD